ncbi:Differentially expressed in FDCP 8 [Nymphon striatum]|nr:Differentially expressed in FDCP 8 [Nymphon striatum]
MSECSSNTDADHSTSEDSLEISNAELGLAEDHFSQPEGHFGMTSAEELEMAIDNCKEMILTCEDNSERKKNLVKKLVQLRMKLQEIKDGPEELPQDTKCILGHHFVRKPAERPKRYCEKCMGLIWGVISGWYMYCGYCSHPKCLMFITRTCANIKITDNPKYNLDICPETGLSTQHYRCTECQSLISPKNGDMEPRLCDYTGSYYCPQCHWNNTAVIPARVLFNWDFERRKVSRASKQFLKLMKRKSVIKLEEINPMLFTFVKELHTIKELREGILIMKIYFVSCKEATEDKLLLKLQDRQHFVENAHMYSMRDIEELESGILVPHIAAIHESYSDHIKKECLICKGKGFICELCDETDTIFPFEHDAAVCSECSSVFHK